MLMFGFCFVCLVLEDRFSLCKPGCHGTHSRLALKRRSTCLCLLGLHHYPWFTVEVLIPSVLLRLGMPLKGLIMLKCCCEYECYSR